MSSQTFTRTFTTPILAACGQWATPGIRLGAEPVYAARLSVGLNVFSLPGTARQPDSTDNQVIPL
jgi:hypothetical protein